MALLPAALALLFLASGAGPSRAAGSLTCPTRCASSPSRVRIVGPSTLTLSVATASTCRRTCNSTSLPFYQFRANGGDGACTCFQNCSRVEKTPQGPRVVIGYGPACPDIKCPVTCSTDRAWTFISSAPPSANSTQSSLAGCQAFCRQAQAVFLQFGVDDSCRCFQSCSATITRNGIVPYSLGYLPACK